MKILKPVVWCGAILFLATPCSLRAQAQSPQNNQKSCRQFVQGFYDWYLPMTLKDNPAKISDLALRAKGHEFSPELLKQLKEDSDAQAKEAGEIVGLDFDPFLNSQDPGERYEAEKTITKGDTCWVEVYGIWSGKKSGKPSVVPELQRRDGHWVFVNFHYRDYKYPEHENLLSILKSLRYSRQKLPK